MNGEPRFEREIKIADFGTSKRLAGLQLCTEDSVGKIVSSL